MLLNETNLYFMSSKNLSAQCIFVFRRIKVKHDFSNFAVSKYLDFLKSLFLKDTLSKDINKRQHEIKLSFKLKIVLPSVVLSLENNVSKNTVSSHYAIFLSEEGRQVYVIHARLTITFS